MSKAIVTKASALLAAGMMAGLTTSAAQAVVVTVTGGANAGEVVFDSAGFESQAPGALGTPATGSYTVNLPANGAQTVLTGASVGAPGGATGAYGGANYLSATRSASGTALSFEFERDIDLANESFTLEFALWGVNEFMAFSIGDEPLGATNAIAGVHRNWRWNQGVVGGTGFGQYGGSNDQLRNAPYNVGAWNTFIYAWDHATATGTVTLNGQTVILEDTATANPTVVNRFYLSPGVNTDNSTTYGIFVDNIPEPASIGLLSAGLLMLARRRAVTR